MISRQGAAIVIFLFWNLIRKRRDVENFMTKNYKKKLKIEANLESNKVLFEKDPDPTTILIWWSPEDGFAFLLS